MKVIKKIMQKKTVRNAAEKKKNVIYGLKEKTIP